MEGPRLEGKIAVVTGGGTGLGRALVLALAERGADVAFSFHASARGADEVAAAVRDQRLRGAGGGGAGRGRPAREQRRRLPQGGAGGADGGRAGRGLRRQRQGGGDGVAGGRSAHAAARGRVDRERRQPGRAAAVAVVSGLLRDQ